MAYGSRGLELILAGEYGSKQQSNRLRGHILNTSRVEREREREQTTNRARPGALKSCPQIALPVGNQMSR